MKHWTICMVALLAGSGAWGCGDDDSASSPSAAATPSSGASPTAEPVAVARDDDAEPDPCALLTEDVVRAVFSVPAETTVSSPPSRNPVHAVCTRTWEKPNADEIREEIARAQQARLREAFQKMRQGKQAQGLLDMAMNFPRADAVVSMNYGPTSESPEVAKTRFDAAMASLAEGITRTVAIDDIADDTTSAKVREAVGDQTVTFQADSASVEGIGDDARWLPRLNQLAILRGKDIIYLNVEIETNADENLEHAKRLAAALLK